jgi:hypothetical protein
VFCAKSVDLLEKTGDRFLQSAEKCRKTQKIATLAVVLAREEGEADARRTSKTGMQSAGW